MPPGMLAFSHSIGLNHLRRRDAEFRQTSRVERDRSSLRDRPSVPRLDAGDRSGGPAAAGPPLRIAVQAAVRYDRDLHELTVREVPAAALPADTDLRGVPAAGRSPRGRLRRTGCSGSRSIRTRRPAPRRRPSTLVLIDLTSSSSSSPASTGSTTILQVNRRRPRGRPPHGERGDREDRILRRGMVKEEIPRAASTGTERWSAAGV